MSGLPGNSDPAACKNSVGQESVFIRRPSEKPLLAPTEAAVLRPIPCIMLLVAAHIIEDRRELLGQPVVRKGIPLSKIHHAAFNAYFIGIDPDFRLYVSKRSLLQDDGQMLEAIKGLNGGQLRLPERTQDLPRSRPRGVAVRSL